jgi:hypothetical protein
MVHGKAFCQVPVKTPPAQTTCGGDLFSVDDASDASFKSAPSLIESGYRQQFADTVGSLEPTNYPATDSPLAGCSGFAVFKGLIYRIAS